LNPEFSSDIQELIDHMSYQVLARKWRPKSFDQLVGQEHVVQALVNGLDQDRVHHAFLFTGTRGVGKTTLARIFAKCLNCEQGMSSTPCGECASCVDIDEGRFVDMLEIDAASRTKVDDTRELLDSVQYTPTRGRYKVYIIDEVHMLSTSSFNALLKTLEEPPPHVKFVLATTDPEKIPVTILSRCLQFNLRRMTPEQVLENLQNIVQSEGIEADTEALSRLARAADGSMRDGLSLLDQAIAFGAGKLTLEEVKQMLGLVDHGHIAAIVLALAEGDAGKMLNIVEELVARSRDLDAVLVSLAETLHRVCLLQCVPDYSDSERSDWESIGEIAGRISLEDAQLFYQIALKGREELGIAPDPRTGLEMTLLRMLAFRPATEGAEPTAKPASAGGGGSTAKSRKPSPAEVAAAAAAAIQSSNSKLAKAPVNKAPENRAAENEEAESTETAPAEHQQVIQPAQQQAADPLEGDASAPSLFASSEPAIEVGSEKAAANVDDDETIEEMWLEMAEDLNIKGPVRELARNLQMKSMATQKWEFVIDHMHRNLASRDYLERLRVAIVERTGLEVELQLSDSVEGVIHTVAAIERSRLRTQLSEAERSIDEDPTVKALKKNLGAKVIEDSIQPVQ
jgi:DNA polymerase-3 subunit gamma/tau